MGEWRTPATVSTGGCFVTGLWGLAAKERGSDSVGSTIEKACEDREDNGERLVDTGASAGTLDENPRGAPRHRWTGIIQTFIYHRSSEPHDLNDIKNTTLRNMDTLIISNSHERFGKTTLTEKRESENIGLASTFPSHFADHDYFIVFCFVLLNTTGSLNNK